jgi:hypothetical protein
MTIQFKGYEDSRLKKISELCQGNLILDIGYAQMPNPYFGNAYKVGLDLQQPLSPSGYNEEHVGDATRIQEVLGNRRFNTIVASEFIEHLENPYEFLRSLKSNLTEDGYLILSTPNPISWPVFFFEAFSSRKFFYTPHHVYYFTPRWVRRLVERSGYHLELVKPVGLLVPGLTSVLPCPAWLSYQVIYVCRPRNEKTGTEHDRG